jgi:hypothetical protein
VAARAHVSWSIVAVEGVEQSAVATSGGLKINNSLLSVVLHD